MKAEYKEGPEARENFKQGMRELFKVPKKQLGAKAKRQPKKATARKASGSDKG